MIASILHLALVPLFLGSVNPGIFNSLVTAREASRKEGKEMVVFFSEKNCDKCESAWQAFVDDAKRMEKYVSTRMDKRDFDGKAFFELLAMPEVPSWVIFHPDGSEKERWQGGWKDAAGNPTLFDRHSNIKEPAVTAQKQPDKNPSSTPIEKSTIPPSPKIIPPASPTHPSITTYVLQAGVFGSEANAQKLLSDIHAKGFTFFEIQPDMKDDKALFRIISSTFPSEAAALSQVKDLEQKGIKCISVAK